jgi:hypothetical protein
MPEAQQSYFDLHISGLGYLSRFRDIGSTGKRRHDPYYAVAISALEGPTNQPTYTYFDARISGSKALEVLQRPEIAAAINDDDARVLASFKVGGVVPESYQVRSGPHAGETRISLKTRLIRVRWIKIKRQGQSGYATVYTDDREDDVVDAAPADSAGINRDDARHGHSAPAAPGNRRFNGQSHAAAGEDRLSA